MAEHIALNGQTIVYDPSLDEAAFVDRARNAAEDPAVTANDMIALVYGLENPILDHDFVPGRAMVTLATLEHPVFQVLADLVDVKRLRLGLIDLDAASARCTIDVPTAARQLGITPQAVRAAIDSRRLSAMYRSGQWWIAPETLTLYKVSGRARSRANRNGSTIGVQS